jgi:hypothetical protein
MMQIFYIYNELIKLEEQRTLFLFYLSSLKRRKTAYSAYILLRVHFMPVGPFFYYCTYAPISFIIVITHMLNCYGFRCVYP